MAGLPPLFGRPFPNPQHTLISCFRDIAIHLTLHVSDSNDPIQYLILGIQHKGSHVKKRSDVQESDFVCAPVAMFQPRPTTMVSRPNVHSSRNKEAICRLPRETQSSGKDSDLKSFEPIFVWFFDCALFLCWSSADTAAKCLWPGLTGEMSLLKFSLRREISKNVYRVPTNYMYCFLRIILQIRCDSLYNMIYRQALQKQIECAWELNAFAWNASNV